MKIRIVKPKKFAAKFHEVVTRDAEQICGTWHGPSRDYTKLLCDADGVLCRVANALDLEYKKNFLTADAVLRSDKIPVVVIEHENDVPGAGHEMRKLGYLNVPLGVLINYPKSVNHDERLLDAYIDDLKAPSAVGNLTRERQPLVIFGTNVDEKISWRYFRFTENGFKRIKQRTPDRSQGAPT